MMPALTPTASSALRLTRTLKFGPWATNERRIAKLWPFSTIDETLVVFELLRGLPRHGQLVLTVAEARQLGQALLALADDVEAGR